MIILEIGSEFLIEKSTNHSVDFSQVFPIRKYMEFFNSGREALALVLTEITPINKKALIPSYICESIIDTFYQYGYEIKFYDVNEKFIPNNNDLQKNIGVFFCLDYFGFDTTTNLNQYVEEIKNDGTIIIEDITHSMFSTKKNRIESDYLIGSIRKWFGVVGGGVALSNNTIEQPLDEEFETYTLKRKEGFKWKKEFFVSKNLSAKERYLTAFSTAEAMLDSNVKYYRMDKESYEIVTRIDIESIKYKRIANYNSLYDGLSSCTDIEIVFPRCTRNSTPLFFVIYLNKDRDKIRRFLIENKIYCPIHWPLNSKASKNSMVINSKILSIPCDQRYGEVDMKRIIDLITFYFKENSEC